MQPFYISKQLFRIEWNVQNKIKKKNSRIWIKFNLLFSIELN